MFKFQNVSWLKRCVRSLNATPTTYQSCPVYINKASDTCTHVFIRQDHMKKPLEQPHKGPYLVQLCFPNVTSLIMTGIKIQFLLIISSQH